MESVSLIESDCIRILLKHPQVSDIKFLFGIFYQFRAYALPLKEMFHIQFNNFFSNYSNKSLDDTFRFINPDILKDLRIRILLSYRYYLDLSKGNSIILKDRTIVHPLNKNQDLGNTGNIFYSCFTYQTDLPIIPYQTPQGFRRPISSQKSSIIPKPASSSVKSDTVISSPLIPLT